MLIESNELQDYLQQIAKRMKDWSFIEQEAIIDVLRDIGGFIDALEAIQAGKNLRQRYEGSLKRLK